MRMRVGSPIVFAIRSRSGSTGIASIITKAFRRDERGRLRHAGAMEKREEAAGATSIVQTRAEVEAVLTDPHCRVRPLAEPVPSGLGRTSAARIFGNLVRMNDGPAHTSRRSAVAAALASFDEAVVREHARAIAARLLDESLDVNRFQFRLPVSVLAKLLGAADDALPDIVDDVAALAHAFAASGDAAAVARGASAADRLLARIAPFGEVDLENTIGFLTQSYDATAGLIGNALLAVARRTAGANNIVREEAFAVVDRVAHEDPSVLTTRRYRDGETIVVQLAAADLPFGFGPHACPGQRIASTIAAAAIETLLARIDPNEAARRVTYRPSPNLHVPIFGSTE
jgi:cytochrome P450